MTQQSRIRHRARVDCADVEDGVVLYDGRTLRLLCGTSAEIWRRVDGASTAADIAASLATAFPAAEAEVRGDVVQFLDELAELGLLHVFEPDGLVRYVRPANVGYVVEADRTLLIDLRDGQRQVLTPTGSRVWALICAEPEAGSAVRTLEGEFPDAPPTLAGDVQALLDELVGAGFLIRRG